jgi:UDP-N-acetylmuramoyl-tripeptide--D-alanyl-D-alanine ligase
MRPMTLRELAAVVGGHVDASDGAPAVTGAVSDSRAAGPDQLFVAIAGARTDGHDHAEAAVAAGSPAVLAARPVGVPAVVVDDPVAALGRLARHVVDDLRARTGLRVIGITGSSGKTTTKDLTAAALAAGGPTVAAEGSLNTEVGLPVTVLRADDTTRHLVLEMSARGVGHIAYLCQVAPPDIAVALNVGTAHLGEFGGPEEVARAKGEIVAGLAPGGTAVLNAADPRVLAMRDRLPEGCTVRTFALDDPFADVAGWDVVVDGATTRMQVSVDGGPPVAVTVPAPGRHVATDALAALGVADLLGVPLPAAAEGLARSRRSRWRMEVADRADGVTVVNDAYNANPESVRAAVAAVRALAAGRRTWAVLGGMGELGSSSESIHRELGRDLAGEVDRLLVVGELGRPILRGAGSGDWAAGVDDALATLRREVAPGDVVLVKASRSEGLERLALALLSPEGARA